MSTRTRAVKPPPLDAAQFRTLLLGWFERHRRDLPWRRTRDPYAIWISEIMLQQTRVAAVIPYYERFLSRFPNVAALADAPEQDLLAYWAGLGYYHRARNLQKAAQAIKQSGSFPDTYEAIRRLPGAGDYTSAAVASIAFNRPHAALDGNVLRVLSRVYADGTDIAAPAGRAHFRGIADQVLDRTQPGAFNQAMMELGATICLPRNPQCLLCPVASLCAARQTGRVHEFPVKLGREKSVVEERVFFWVEREGSVLLWQRPQDARLMPGFYELPERVHLPGIQAGELLGEFRHAITFHNYRCRVYEAVPPEDTGACGWVRMRELPQLPVSTLLRKAERLCRRTRTVF
ncbi:MAG TPA: A/G-specific adenine glycosylase [Bryobacteraceae bacterium]|nr:A/G-specific adenine glycosylase [Bryobacteraceae bacterium]